MRGRWDLVWNKPLPIHTAPPLMKSCSSVSARFCWCCFKYTILSDKQSVWERLGGRGRRRGGGRRSSDLDERRWEHNGKEWRQWKSWWKCYAFPSAEMLFFPLKILYYQLKKRRRRRRRRKHRKPWNRNLKIWWYDLVFLKMLYHRFNLFKLKSWCCKL